MTSSHRPKGRAPPPTPKRCSTRLHQAARNVLTHRQSAPQHSGVVYWGALQKHVQLNHFGHVVPQPDLAALHQGQV
jgi:hypothetical protein